MYNFNNFNVPQNTFAYVSGVEEAKNYQVAPNQWYCL